MRLSAILFAVLAFAGVGAAAWRIAEHATAWFEERTAAEVTAALEAAGQDWAEIATDGLKVTLAGAAPDETSRFRALEIARQIVDEGRITDTTTLAATEPLPPRALRARAPAQRGGRVADRAGPRDRRPRRHRARRSAPAASTST